MVRKVLGESGGIPEGEQDILTYQAESDCVQLDTIADKMARDIPASDKQAKIIVIIPAHNEEDSLPSCLDAMAAQYAMKGVPVDYGDFEVLVLCHNCTDHTFQAGRKIQHTYPFLNLHLLQVARPEVNNVGAARRVLMRIASRRVALDSGYIVSTDADTIVDPFWIANLMGYINSGYGLICGRIAIDTSGISGNARKTLEHKQNYFQLRARLEYLISPDLTNPWPRHAHNSGPNLAVRKDVYAEIGGMPPKGFLEDIALYDAVCEKGHTIRHCPFTVVTTSGRMTPRAPWGFGSELRDWDQAPTLFFEVEGLDRLLAKFRIFEQVRTYYKNPSPDSFERICRGSGLAASKIQKYLTFYSCARPVINKIDRELDKLGSWQRKYPLKLVSLAEKELQDYLGVDTADFNHT